MADERIKIKDGELLDAIKGQENTDTRVSIPMGEILDAIKAASSGSSGDSIWIQDGNNPVHLKNKDKIGFQGEPLKNLGDPIEDNDAVNKKYVDLKANKIKISSWTKLDLGAVPWEETNPELQIINKFCGLNARVKSDGVEIEWPNDSYFELKELNNIENKKLATNAVLYGTNELYTGEITVNFNFDDTLPPTIRTFGKSGWGGYVQNLIDKKQDQGDYPLKTYVDSQDTTTLNNAKIYTNQQVKIPNDKNTEQDTRLNNDEATINGLTTSKQDKLTAGANITIDNNVISSTGGSGSSSFDLNLQNNSSFVEYKTWPSGASTLMLTTKQYVDDEDAGIRKQHQIDFGVLQTQIGQKQPQLIAGNGIKISGNTISIDPTVVTIWKPVTITQPTNRVANFTLTTGVYRIGFTFDQPTEVNYQYVTYRVVNVAGQNNEILTFYRDSGVEGAIPNVLALRCVSTGFEIYDKYGTSNGYGAIMKVDIQATT